MKKFILMLLLLVSTMGYAQESESDDFKNHAFRMYGSVGTGYPSQNLGVGLSYAYEAGNFGKNKDVFLGVSTDMQLGISMVPWLVFNAQFSISVGKLYQNGGRFSYDILGSGFGLMYDLGESSFLESYIPRIDPWHVVLNFFSFHYTSNNGFYFSWRNNLLITGLEYRSYFTLGFDFSKLYNPRVYRER